MGALTDDVRTLLEGTNFAHVATILPDGGPHTVPVWVDTEGDLIVFFTQTGTRKARNLERDGRVALSLVDGANPYRTAQIRGRVVEKRTGDAAEVVIERLARKFTDEPFPWRSPNSVLYVIEPERVRFMELPFVHRPSS
jgi:PPOX class probable F420-dependent enzyme